MPVKHHRVRLNGTFANGEVWSCSFAFASTAGIVISGYDELKEWADAVAALPAATMVPTGLRNFMGSNTSLRTVRMEYFNDAGEMEMAAQSNWATPITNSTAPSMPTQCAVVVSLLTGRPGRSYSGRFYWPCTAGPIDATTGRISSTNTAAAATAARQMINAVGAAAPALALLQAVVVSNTIDVATPISQVRVGDVIDTQRRRRDALVEVYATVPLP